MLKILNLSENLLISKSVAKEDKIVDGYKSSKINLSKSQKLKNTIILSNAKAKKFLTSKTSIAVI